MFRKMFGSKSGKRRPGWLKSVDNMLQKDDKNLLADHRTAHVRPDLKQEMEQKVEAKQGDLAFHIYDMRHRNAMLQQSNDLDYNESSLDESEAFTKGRNDLLEEDRQIQGASYNSLSKRMKRKIGGRLYQDHRLKKMLRREQETHMAMPNYFSRMMEPSEEKAVAPAVAQAPKVKWYERFRRTPKAAPKPTIRPEDLNNDTIREDGEDVKIPKWVIDVDKDNKIGTFENLIHDSNSRTRPRRQRTVVPAVEAPQPMAYAEETPAQTVSEQELAEALAWEPRRRKRKQRTMEF